MHIPQNGFYYHYKHDPNGEFNNYAYEVTGIGHHSEREVLDEASASVIYRPLFATAIYDIGKRSNVRPLEMFTANVIKDGVEMLRFQKITDPELIAKLKKVRDEMY